MSGKPAGWELDLTGGATVERESTTVFSGVYSLKYTNPDNATNGGWHGLRLKDSQLGYFSLPLRPGSTHRIRAAVKVSSTTGAPKFRLFLYHNVAATITQNKEFTPVDTDFNLYEWTFTVPLNAEPNSSLFVQFNRNGQAGTYNFWLDSVRPIEQETGAAGANDLADSGREDLILNGDFESGFAWWSALVPGTDVNKVFMETGADKYKGSKSLRFEGTAVAWSSTLEMTDDTGDVTKGGKVLLVRVFPNDRLRVRAACKLSAASGMSGLLRVRLYRHDKVLDDDTARITWSTETAWTEKEVTVNLTGTTDIYYVSIAVSGNGAAATDKVWFDEIHVWRMKKGADIVDRSVQGIKLVGEAVNAQEFGQDVPDLIRGRGGNPDNLALNGNAEYATFLSGSYTATPTGFWGATVGLGSSASSHKGSFALALTDSASVVIDAFQVGHSIGATTITEKILIPVRPGEKLYFRAAGALSAATQHVLRLGVERFSDTRTSQAKDTVLSWTTETLFTEKQTTYTVPSTTFFVCLWISTDITAGTPAAQRIDEIYVYRLSTELHDGTVGAPALSFVSDPDTGLYRSAENIMGLVAGGTDWVRITANGMGVLLGGSTAYGATTRIVGQLGLLSTTSTVEVELGAISLPANTLSVNGDALRITLFGYRFGGSATTSQMRVRFGATTYVMTITFDNVGVDHPFKSEIMLTRVSGVLQAAVAVTVHDPAGTVVPLIERSLPAETLSGAVSISFRASNSNAANTVQLDHAVVEFLRF